MKKEKTTALAAILLAVLIASVSSFGQSDGNRSDMNKSMEPVMEPAMNMTNDGTAAVPPPGVENGRYVKPPFEELEKKLTKLQLEVTQMKGTERPYSNRYWDNKKKGIYVDIVSGEPLFSSTDKYDSGTGWPSFTRPLEEGNIISLTDDSLGMIRIEVRSLFGDSHLGHLFNDGPKPTGLRYCINSASLRFVPLENLEKEGYGQYVSLFGMEEKK